MPFNAEITFTGICTLVMDSLNPRGVIVAPHAWSTTQIHPEFACDGQNLRRHRCFLDVPLKHLEGNSSALGDLCVLRDLHEKRVRFEVTGGPANLQEGDLSNVANWNTVAPGFSTVDPSLLVNNPPPNRIAAQIILDQGVLQGGDPLTSNGLPITWAFPGTLTTDGKPTTAKLTPELLLQLNGVDSLAVKIENFDGSSPETVTLDGTAGTVKMTIAHLCDENPLRWETLTNNLPPDGDFRWYFNLLDDAAKEALAEELVFGLPLPVPFPTERRNGQGVNCFPSQSTSQALLAELFS